MKKARFSDHLVLAVKDRLRDVRFHIRRNARDETARDAQKGAPRGPHPVAFAADVMFSGLQAAATVLLPGPERTSENFLFPLPVASYFGADGDNGAAFTVEIYYALKGLLRRFGADEFFVSEQAVEDIRDRMAERRGALVTAALEADVPVPEASRRIARLCAALAVDIAASRPIKEMLLGPDVKEQPKNLLLSPNAYCGLVIGLSIAIVSLPGREGPVGRELALRSADLAVDAQFKSLSGAMQHRDPVMALTTEFERLLSFLP